MMTARDTLRVLFPVVVGYSSYMLLARRGTHVGTQVIGPSLVGALVAFASACAIYQRSPRRMGFYMAYSLYAHTRVGLYVHKMFVNQSRQKKPHRESSCYFGPSVDVHIIPYASDNYAYLIVHKQSSKAVVVDPGDADAVIDALAGLPDSIQLIGILTTHRHWDHAGGNTALVTRFPELTVIGGEGEGVDACTQTVKDGERFSVGPMDFTAFRSGCHTPHHMSFYIQDDKSTEASREAYLFTGDFLFLGGCGRFFEGRAIDMHAALQHVTSLPPYTKIFCGHEYTVQNLKFAREVEPDNPDIARALQDAKAKRKDGVPTVPGQLSQELLTNPFLRYNTLAVQSFAAPNTPPQDPPPLKTQVYVIKTLRDCKDVF